MKTSKLVLAAVVSLGLVAAACGDDEEGSGVNASTTTALDETTTTTPDASEPSGSLDPQPLAERASVTIGVTAPIELFATPYLAVQLGEFEAENLDVEIVTLSTPDAIGQIASGNIDACTCAVSPAALNAIDTGVPLKLVSSLFLQLDPASALYVDPDLADDAPASLKGKRVAIAGGWASPVALPIKGWLESADMTLDDLELVVVANTDILTALESGAADAAFLNAPFNAQAVENGTGVFMEETAPESGSVSLGIWYGDRLLEQDPDVGAAVLRALARTNQMHLAPGYRDNEETMAALATALGTTPDALGTGTEPIFAPELEFGDWGDQIIELQQIWLKVGGILDFSDPIPESEIIDEDPLTKVVG